MLDIDDRICQKRGNEERRKPVQNYDRRIDQILALRCGSSLLFKLPRHKWERERRKALFFVEIWYVDFSVSIPPSLSRSCFLGKPCISEIVNILSSCLTKFGRSERLSHLKAPLMLLTQIWNSETSHIIYDTMNGIIMSIRLERLENPISQLVCPCSRSMTLTMIMLLQ